ncbi:tellurite resistance TerB family protein [Vibrio aphrogenes]|uniref:tellurite resistance TerB family protein n=1 Tax=Vibrio aphrogenes TaxID=1891186 RepID=UPI000B35E8A9|nr:TerB family tellurite resistance protein [Vibrio aphrogenes]
MIQSLKTLFSQLIEDQKQSQSTLNPNLAIASLLCQVSQADHNVDEQERSTQQQMLMKLLSISATDAASLLEQAEQLAQNSASLYEFTDHLRDLEHQQRFDVIQSLWQVAYADHYLDPIEEAIIRKVAELLYVNHTDYIRAKLSVAPDR